MRMIQVCSQYNFNEHFFNIRVLFLQEKKYYAYFQTVQYSKICNQRPLKKKTKIGFQEQSSINAGQKYYRILSWSILQYVRPSLSYPISLRPLFCLFMSDRLRQVFCIKVLKHEQRKPVQQVHA